MNTALKIFQPNPIEEHAVSTVLNVTTPRGLFLSDDGNRYIVCDHPKRHFATGERSRNLCKSTSNWKRKTALLVDLAV